MLEGSGSCDDDRRPQRNDARETLAQRFRRGGWALAQAAGIGALADQEFVYRSLEENARGLRLFTDSFSEMDIAVVPSEANFVMLPFPDADTAAGVVEGRRRGDQLPALLRHQRSGRYSRGRSRSIFGGA